ncbi:MAG: hypothetical protein DMF61_01075 [Blastocatellia bacterium AA13]|nr:MAG: hypothetical protein DMF61_01075 [Blastocatellia bacterium AA13]
MDSLPSEWTVTELLRRCAVRPVDDAAWAEFLKRYHSTIRMHVSRTFHSRGKDQDRRQQFSEDSIEDLVQLVYYRLIGESSIALKRFEGAYENSIYQYLAMISRNVVRDHFREMEALKRPKISHSLTQLVDNDGEIRSTLNGLGFEGRIEAASTIDFTFEEIERVLMKAAGWRNRDRDLTIFRLHYLEGLTLEEVAKALNLHMTTVGVNSIITRLTTRIRKILDRSSSPIHR